MNISLINVLVSIVITSSIFTSNSASDILPVIDSVINEGEYKAIETFNGTITGYGPDCYGCSGEGYLSCRTENGDRHSLKYDSIYYNDSTYGEVKILAAAHKKFPCGTIIEVEKNGTKFLGVVLDTGGTMRKAWNERNEVWIDVAYSTEKEAEIQMPHSKNINYSILRYGWK